MRRAAVCLSLALALALPATAGAAIGFKLGPGSPFGHPGSAGQGLATGDFNRDGKLDLASEAANEAVLFLGDGAGGVSATRTFAISAGNATKVATADFNRDGNPDLAVANGSAPGTVTVLLGDGAGSLNATAQSPIGGLGGNQAVDVVSADFNHDQNPDLAVALKQAPGRVAFLRGDGTGGFAPFAGSPVDSDGTSPVGLATGDFNQDFHTDVAIANAGPPARMGMLLGNGSGGFGRGSFSGAVFPLAGAPSQVAAPDLISGNGPDLAVTLGSANTIAVYRNRTDGTATFDLVAAPSPAGSGPFGMAEGDFDADTDSDLAVANQGSGGVTVLEGNGSGAVPQAGGSPFGTGAAATTPVAVGDFNGDRQPDIAAVNAAGSPTAAILLNTDAAGLALDPSSVDFGTSEIGVATPNRNITVRNDGTGYLEFRGVGGQGAFGGDFPITAGNCFFGRLLPPGGTCFVTAAFKPSGFGPRTGGLEIFSNAPGTPHRVALKGSGPAAPPAPIADVTAPVITGVRADPATFAVGRSATATVAAKKKKATTRQGTTFRFALSEDARVQLALRRKHSGKRKGKRCVKPSRKLRKARACTRLVTAGALRRGGTAGANAVPFSGRVGRKALARGRYQVDVAASDTSGNKSRVASASFRVVAK